MPAMSQNRIFATPTALLKTLVISTAIVTTAILSGCASKPQINIRPVTRRHLTITPFVQGIP